MVGGEALGRVLAAEIGNGGLEIAGVLELGFGRDRGDGAGSGGEVVDKIDLGKGVVPEFVGVVVNDEVLVFFEVIDVDAAWLEGAFLALGAAAWWGCCQAVGDGDGKSSGVEDFFAVWRKVDIFGRSGGDL